MRNNLNGLAEVVTTALFFDHALVDAARRDVVGTGGLDACKPLVMTEVEVSFLSVHCNITFSVLVGVERTRIDVDVRIKFLDSNIISSGL